MSKPEEANHRDIPIDQALRLLRAQQKLTQKELTQCGGPDVRTISHWETGRKMPSFPLLLQYLDALELDLHDLQAVFDQIAKRQGMISRVTNIEQRLVALERSLMPPSNPSES